MKERKNEMTVGRKKERRNNPENGFNRKDNQRNINC